MARSDNNKIDLRIRECYRIFKTASRNFGNIGFRITLRFFSTQKRTFLNGKKRDIPLSEFLLLAKHYRNLLFRVWRYFDIA